MSVNIGDLLKQTREEKNMTLEQISEETKIQKRYLKALEDEKFEELPGEVHVKGFMRNYCKAVGLNPDEVVALYKEQNEEVLIRPKEEILEDEEKNRKVLYIIGLLIIIAIVVIIFVLRPKNEPIVEDTSVSQKVESSELHKEEIKEVKEADTNLGEVEKESQVVNNTARREEVAAEEVNNEEKIEEKTEGKTEKALETPELAVQNEIQTKPEKIEEKETELKETEQKTEVKQEVNFTKNIEVLVEGKSWIEVKKNSEVVFSGIIQETKKVYQGMDNDRFEFKIGNAGSVKIIYNNEDLGILGKERQVVRKRF